jgi:hypothetical protein
VSHALPYPGTVVERPEHAVPKPLMSSALVAEVPLAGLTFSKQEGDGADSGSADQEEAIVPHADHPIMAI